MKAAPTAVEPSHPGGNREPVSGGHTGRPYGGSRSGQELVGVYRRAVQEDGEVQVGVFSQLQHGGAAHDADGVSGGDGLSGGHGGTLGQIAVVGGVAIVVLDHHGGPVGLVLIGGGDGDVPGGHDRFALGGGQIHAVVDAPVLGGGIIGQSLHGIIADHGPAHRSHRHGFRNGSTGAGLGLGLGSALGPALGPALGRGGFGLGGCGRLLGRLRI